MAGVLDVELGHGTVAVCIACGTVRQRQRIGVDSATTSHLTDGDLVVAVAVTDQRCGARRCSCQQHTQTRCADRHQDSPIRHHLLCSLSIRTQCCPAVVRAHRANSCREAHCTVMLPAAPPTGRSSPVALAAPGVFANDFAPVLAPASILKLQLTTGPSAIGSTLLKLITPTRRILLDPDAGNTDSSAILFAALTVQSGVTLSPCRATLTWVESYWMSFDVA